MSKVKINEAAISRFFGRSPLAGTGLGGGGVASAEAQRTALRMISFVEAEIKKDFKIRTAELALSLVPIFYPDPRGGTRVGVGSTAPHAKWLTEGTRPHDIGPLTPVLGRPRWLKSNGPRSKGPNPTPLMDPEFRLSVKHPGNAPNDFIRRGVNLAIGRPVL